MRPISCFLLVLTIVIFTKPGHAQVPGQGTPIVRGYSNVPAPSPVRVPIGVAPGYTAAGPYRYPIQPNVRSVPAYRYGGWQYAPPQSNSYSYPQHHGFRSPKGFGFGRSGFSPAGAFPPPMIGG